jgi:hypothetical protein
MRAWKMAMTPFSLAGTAGAALAVSDIRLATDPTGAVCPN